MTDTITTAFEARKAFRLETAEDVAQLLDFHRGFFGDARMEAAAGDSDGGSQDEGQGDPTPGQGEHGGDGASRQGDEPLGEGGKKALTAEREANRALRSEKQDLENRLREYEDRDKSEEQKQADRLAELERKAATAEQSIAEKDALILKYQVAAEKGLDLVAAERLRGTTKDEIAQDADDWLSRWGNPRTPGRDLPDRGQGPRHNAPEDDFAAGLERARKRFANQNT